VAMNFYVCNTFFLVDRAWMLFVMIIVYLLSFFRGELDGRMDGWMDDIPGFWFFLFVELCR